MVTSSYDYLVFKERMFQERITPSKLNKQETVNVLSVRKDCVILRKEVIQPHLPIRLPCYDFTPVIDPTLGGWLLKGYLTDFGCCQLPWCDGRCVQGPGTNSPQHADLRLLAIPASCRRVAACNPNCDRLIRIGSTSRLRFPLYRPL